MSKFALDISKTRIGICVYLTKDRYDLLSIPTYNINLLINLYKKYEVEITYIGLPYQEDGSLSDNATFIKKFVHNNRLLFKPFKYINEAYSTKIGKSYSTKDSDKFAALVILKRGINGI